MEYRYLFRVVYWSHHSLRFKIFAYSVFKMKHENAIINVMLFGVIWAHMKSSYSIKLSELCRYLVPSYRMGNIVILSLCNTCLSKSRSYRDSLNGFKGLDLLHSIWYNLSFYLKRTIQFHKSIACNYFNSIYFYFLFFIIIGSSQTTLQIIYKNSIQTILITLYNYQ